MTIRPHFDSLLLNRYMFPMVQLDIRKDFLLLWRLKNRLVESDFLLSRGALCR